VSYNVYGCQTYRRVLCHSGVSARALGSVAERRLLISAINSLRYKSSSSVRSWMKDQRKSLSLLAPANWEACVRVRLFSFDRLVACTRLGVRYIWPSGYIMPSCWTSDMFLYMYGLESVTFSFSHPVANATVLLSGCSRRLILCIRFAKCAID
jgi:hypothetical protein